MICLRYPPKPPILIANQLQSQFNIKNKSTKSLSIPTKRKKRPQSSSSSKSLQFSRRNFNSIMAVESNDAAAPAAIMLTSGASGRVIALLSLRAWRSLLVLINALFLILIFPFRGRKHCSVSPMGSPALCSSSSPEKGGREKRGKGLPATVVPWKSGSPELAATARRELAIRRVTQEAARDEDSVRDFSLFVTLRGDTLFTQTWTPVSIKVRSVVIYYSFYLYL